MPQRPGHALAGSGVWLQETEKGESITSTLYYSLTFLTVQFSSVTQSCPVLCNPMDCSTPGFPALHHLPELAQTHVH